ncbi:Dyp-type peroxidase domain-containing protein [Xenophilus azovorans]|uniref:Dyp-type peroxidase domain-containing protein n=1 Tax=Xenophilus azovorans TaxID=151755 RepID=UPI00057121AA|nr:Dyp-type peroxidase domain-containing protein [Xenophilus azovorans]
MPADPTSKSRTLRGISDLTLLAPIRRGLVPAPDARSYESRLRLLLRTVNALRYSSLEAEPTPLIPDVVDSIRALHAFRLAIVPAQPVNQLLLSVDFDGGWEPYMRRIWRDLGPLLDVIFCNCEGYLLSHEHPFEAYAGWVRSAQVNTEFLYTASPVTVNDLHWLRATQRPTRAAPPGTDEELLRQALPGLAALYRLTDVYPPGSPDGDVLLRAAHHLLQPLRGLPPARRQGRTPTEQAALAWFDLPAAPRPARDVPAAWNPANTQGGIVESFPDATHGAVLLLGLRDAGAAAALIDALGPERLRADAAPAPDEPFASLAFTPRGLRRAGLPEGLLAAFPPEFLEGMAGRAAVLGDMACNHPLHWTPPERNWPAPAPGEAPQRIELGSVHAVLQLVARGPVEGPWEAQPGHPLRRRIEALDAALAPHGVRILSVEPMQRHLDAQGHQRDHFGFADGLSNPAPPQGGARPQPWDRWALGDYLLGYTNSQQEDTPSGWLWTDSSFLVVRKLRQDTATLEALLAPLPPAQREEAMAHMVGRWPDGRSLMDPDGRLGNDFDYRADPDGRRCPFAAHARRANPRDLPGERADQRVLPRILRRGMAYGPPAQQGPQADRGVMFMAYNASIAEQFELIQSWLSGGNSGGVQAYSGQRDPLFGVPREGDPAVFRYEGAHGPVEVPLGPKPAVTLQWGLYLFAPSIEALRELRRLAREQARREARGADAEAAERQRATEAKKGAVLIARLQAAEAALGVAAAAEQWKIALEDLSARQSGASQWLWTAVRELHGGVLRTPFGVLVGRREQVMEVFDNRLGRYTVSGYCPRMRASFGEIYLGLDDGPDYRAASRAANAAILAVTRGAAFAQALADAQVVLAGLRAGAGGQAGVDVKDIVNGVLARLATHFFGFPDPGGGVAVGDVGLDAARPTCPGHFLAPSRYMFQPNPGPEAARTGEAHGRVLREHVLQRLRAGLRTANRSAVGQALAGIEDDAQYAATLIGVMMGFLPTVDGSLRSALYEWVDDRSLWELQLAWRAAREAGRTPFEAAAEAIEPALRRTMQLRPVPELVWRTAAAAHRLGGVDIAPGERIVVGIVSAMQQSRLEGEPDIGPVFGGDRRAAPHPTHACPGQEMAMGVMLGLLAALLDTPLRPTLAATVLHLG